MNFALNEDQAAVFEMAKVFGAAEIAAHALAWDRAGTIPRDFWLRAGKSSFESLSVSEDSGGAGLGRVE